MTQFEKHYLIKGIIIEVIVLFVGFLLQTIFKFIPAYNDDSILGSWLVVAHDLIVPALLVFGALIYLVYYNKKLSDAQDATEEDQI